MSRGRPVWAADSWAERAGGGPRPPHLGGLQILQHKVPELGGRVQQQELEAGRGNAGGLSWLGTLHEPSLTEELGQVLADGRTRGAHHEVQDHLPSLLCVLVEGGDIPGMLVGSQLTCVIRPGLPPTEKGDAEVLAEDGVEDEALEASREQLGVPDPEAAQQPRTLLLSLAELLLHPQGYGSLRQRLLQKEHPHHPVLSQRWELSEDSQTGGRVPIQSIQNPRA